MSATPWNTGEPPHDGSLIIAIGKIMESADACTWADPLCAPIRWTALPGQIAGWHYQSGMSVRRSLDEEVIIHYWLPMPTAEVPGSTTEKL